jgi:hypothetical protein
MPIPLILRYYFFIPLHHPSIRSRSWCLRRGHHVYDRVNTDRHRYASGSWSGAGTKDHAGLQKGAVRGDSRAFKMAVASTA